MTATPPAQATRRPSPVSRLWRRQLDRYPDDGPRAFYLGLVVVITIVLYYQLFIQGAVATSIIRDHELSLVGFAMVSIVGYAVGAFGSLFAGLADRWGRANLVVGGLLITSLIVWFGLPNASDGVWYTVLFALLSIVEGIALVATPALVRDFSPQLGRASAMGFWTLGPVLGSLVVTSVSSNTLDTHPDWRYQFVLSGVAGLAVFVVALVGLRELSPALRDQLMVSREDRALVEARAVEGAAADTSGSWRQMLRLDVAGPALAISLFLLFYYFLVGFFVVYYAANFGWTEARSNGLANWYWISNAFALVLTGVLSDRLRVRKPFMVAGALLSAAGVAVFAELAREPGTSYASFAWLLAVIAFGAGIAYAAWMAAFTETVEKRNPAATATGLAVWGAILRFVVPASLAGLLLAVPSAAVIVDHGPDTQAIVGRYPDQVATLQELSPTQRDALHRMPDSAAVQTSALATLTGLSVYQTGRIVQLSRENAADIETLQAIAPPTQAALIADRNDPAAVSAAVADISARFGIGPAAAGERLLAAAGAVSNPDLRLLQRHGAEVRAAGERLESVRTIPPRDLDYLAEHGDAVLAAQADSPDQWRRWWWIAFAGQLAFIPFVFLMAGHWNPRRAREEAEVHAESVRLELELRELTRTPARSG